MRGEQVRKAVVGVGAPLGAALLIAAGVWAARGQTAAIQPYFTDNAAATAITTTVTALEQALLNRIHGATTSIDAAIYDFNRASVRDALLAAQARGVAVRVVGDDDAAADPKSLPNFDALRAAGIAVVLDGPPAAAALLSPPDGWAEMAAAPEAPATSHLMHDKYLIVDHRVIWTGSTNFSDSDITLNQNNALEIESPALAALYQADFDQMIGGVFGNEKTPLVTHTVAISGTSVGIYFAPQDDPMAQIVAAVNAAQETIDFAIFTFTADPLADALIAAQARGVRVRGLWDALAAGNAAADDARMCAAGMAIKIENTRGLMHNKLLVIDAQASAPLVITGSLNWTADGNTLNNENTLFLHSAPLAQTYAAAYQALWGAIAVQPCNPEAAVARAVRLPVVFRQAAAPTPTPVPVGPTPTPTPTATLTPTPTATPAPTGGAPALVRMSRIVYDPPGSDLAGEFVEIVNNGADAATLTAWTLRDAAEAVFTFPAFDLPPGAAVKVWVKAGSNGAADLFWGRAVPVWNNDGDVATLRDGSGVQVGQCAYAPDTGEALCP